MGVGTDISSRRTGFHRLIGRVHRRMVVLRLIEGAGIGALVGSLFALALVLLLYWHGSSSLFVPIAGSMFLGLIGGLFRAWTHRPSPLAAAIQVDAQLNLQDLLSTAMHLASRANESWNQSIIHLADARCARISTGSLVLHRLGVKGWGAISLVATLTLILAFLATSTTQMRADEALETTRLAAQHVDERPSRPLLVLAADGSMRRPSAPAEAEDIGQNNPNGEPSQRAQTPESTSLAHADTAERPNPQGPPTAQSAGSQGARTNVDQTAQPRSHAPQSISNQQISQSPDSKVAGGGSSPPDARTQPPRGDEPPDNASGAGSAAPSPAHTRDIPPWQTERWDADITAAQQAIRSDRVAPAFHDIVRDYFQRNP